MTGVISVLIDTNVLIYATLDKDPRHEVAREIVIGTSPWVTGCQLFVSAQNLAEMWPNLTGPKLDPPDSPEMARRKIESIAGSPNLTVLPVDAAVVREALRLCDLHQVRRQRYYDMQIAALMRCHGIGRIFTENDRDFLGIEGVDAVNPFEASAAGAGE